MVRNGGSLTGSYCHTDLSTNFCTTAKIPHTTASTTKHKLLRWCQKNIMMQDIRWLHLYAKQNRLSASNSSYFYLLSSFDIQGTVHRDIFLQWKPTRCTISQIYLTKYSTCFGHVPYPSSGVSQHCIHAIGICHSSSVGVC